MLELHRGQGLDIYWRDHVVCPTEEEYCYMVQQKTGGLFRLSTRLMQAFSEDKRDYMPLCNDLGLFFQVADDLLNLDSPEYHKNKSFAEDLTEGKFSFPVVHCLRNAQHPGSTALLNILRQRTSNLELKKYAIEQMRSAGSFAYTSEYLHLRYQRIMHTLEGLGGNPVLVSLLDQWMKKLTTSEPPATAD